MRGKLSGMAGVMLRHRSCVPKPTVGMSIRASLRVKARILRTHVLIFVGYHMVAKRSSLASSAAVHAGQPDPVRQRGRCFLVSTKSDELTSREERFGGGGTNVVYDYVTRSTGRQCHMHREILVVL